MRYTKKAHRGEAARVIREARQGAGLTQVQLARRARVTQPVIAAYESGTREPSVPMLMRLVEASGNHLVMQFEPDSSAYRLADLAHDVRGATGDTRRLRLVFEFLRGAQDDAEPLQALVTAAPRTTGDVRFDALIGAIAEHLCVASDTPTPRWALAPDRFLHRPWWVSKLPSAKRRALVHTPASFRRRGVMIDLHDLISA